jgi:hypothetical protein
MLRYEQIAQNETKLLALTGLTRREFEDLVPVFQASFATVLREQTLDGLDRVGRAYTTYRNSPLPMAEDKLLFMLVYLKQAPPKPCMGNASAWRNPMPTHGFTSCIGS